MFNLRISYTFVCRCLMKRRPFLISIVVLSIGVVIFGHAVRIAEKPMKLATDRMDHTKYENCVWEAFITMSTGNCA